MTGSLNNLLNLLNETLRKSSPIFLVGLEFLCHGIDRHDGMIEVSRHTLTISMMANASMTVAFRGGKVLPDAAMTLSAERLPALVASRRSFPVGFHPVMFILLVLLVPIVMFVFMMMVVDNRNG